MRGCGNTEERLGEDIVLENIGDINSAYDLNHLDVFGIYINISFHSIMNPLKSV